MRTTRQPTRLKDDRTVDLRYHEWSSPEELMSETTRLIEFLRGVLHTPPRLQREAPIQAVMFAVNKIATDESTLASGDFLSRICRLPDVWKHVAMEYVNNDGGYRGGSYELQSTFLNAGPSTVRYLSASIAVPVLTSDGRATDRTNTRKIYGALDPGDTVTLSTKFAIHLLWEKGRYARPFHQMQLGIPSLAERPIIEVGFSAKWLDTADPRHADFVTKSSQTWQSEQVAELVRLAARAAEDGDRAEALRIISEVSLRRTDQEHQKTANEKAAKEASAAGIEFRPRDIVLFDGGEHYWWPRSAELEELEARLMAVPQTGHAEAVDSEGKRDAAVRAARQGRDRPA